MSRFKDLTGQRFGRLTVIKQALPKRKTYSEWICLCDCKTIKTIACRALLKGATVSCGCYKRKHGCSKTRLYNIYISIKKRCYKPYEKQYKYYGGRGIEMCKEWRDNFTNFRDWALLHGYNNDLEIDRIDVNGHYCPENCRWVTILEQANNKRNTIYIEHDGQRKTLRQISEESGIAIQFVRNRYNRSKLPTYETLTKK